jgi:membrane associated rhomboid family serine protease
MINFRGWLTRRWPGKLVALAILLSLAPGCLLNPAQIYIPLGYAFTGLCIALLISPTYTAAIVGLVVGGLIGAAVYNNSLKRQLLERQQPETAPGK